MKRQVPGCSGKIRHPSKGAAVAVMKRMNNAQLSAYRCRSCRSWHVGRHPKKIQLRLDQLLGPADPPA